MLALAGMLIPLTAVQASTPAPRPKLLVLIVFDQLRGDYLIRWEPHLGPGGFRRLLSDGAWFQNCHYPYAGTFTGAGHASLMAGCSPESHGVVANEWYDPDQKKSINCVWSLKHERVPMISGKTTSGKVSPENLRAESFGDVLKEATAEDGRIVALSFKDRSAVLPGGHRANACYWFENSTGTFITSTHYTDVIHPWVETFNKERLVDSWFGKDWTRLRIDLDYDKLVGPDDVKGEGSGSKQGRTFPHPTTGGAERPESAYYQALYNSPYGNELLLRLAQRALVAEELGQDDVPDLLTISFSSNDAVGHAWGPDSQEVFDMTLRSDLVMKELLETLDAHVGAGRYLVALSADHGVCRIPEVAKADSKDAGRVPSTALRREAEEFLEAEFGLSGPQKPAWIESVTNGWFYLNRATIQARGAKLADVELSLAAWLSRQTGIYRAFARGQLSQIAPTDVIGQRVLRSFTPDRCGDVLIVLKPQWLLGDQTSGTTHGSPFGYDSHVPLLVYGPGIRKGIRSERVSPTAIAPIFARSLGMRPPKSADTLVPDNLFDSSSP